MGYLALLFCPDEKTARTVTQVLNELEFSVEACTEPFAAVKKLMGQHFDALVVDCDNEQNATLLFKSARNSQSNQASLAVAVVEGQVGVAKAFRIGANLVLTKPINVEQAKGTLRVARGLLRKGDPAKATATSTAATKTPAQSSKAAIPSAAAKPSAPDAAPWAAMPRPSAPEPATKPATNPSAWPIVPATPAAASSASHAPSHHAPSHHAEDHHAQDDEDIIDISAEDPAPSFAPDAAPVAPFAPPVFKHAPMQATVQHPAQAAASPASHSSSGFGAGAASAPARARTTSDSSAGPATASKPSHDAEPLFDTAVELGQRTEVRSSTSTAPEPSFTFGGANAPQSSGGSKKVLLAVAATVLIATGLYAGWTHFRGTQSPSSVINPDAANPDVPKPAASKPAAPVQLATSPAPQPAKVQPTPSSSAPVSSASAPASSQPDTTTEMSDDSTPTDNHRPTHSPSAQKPSAGVSTPSLAKNSSSAASAGKAAFYSHPAAQPIVVKTGTALPGHAKPAAADAPAPSMIGLAPATSGGSLSNLVAGEPNAPQPVLQTVNVSQGVSQGLLIKKIPPSYPANALRMHVEGSVQLLATISKSGNISAVKVLSGDALLSRAAQEAVKQWKYKPYLLNGEPVEIQTQVTINFKLPR